VSDFDTKNTWGLYKAQREQELIDKFVAQHPELPLDAAAEMAHEYLDEQTD